MVSIDLNLKKLKFDAWLECEEPRGLATSRWPVESATGGETIIASQHARSTGSHVYLAGYHNHHQATVTHKQVPVWCQWISATDPRGRPHVLRLPRCRCLTSPQEALLRHEWKRESQVHVPFPVQSSRRNGLIHRQLHSQHWKRLPECISRPNDAHHCRAQKVQEKGQWPETCP